MEEKILIKSKQYNVKIFSLIMIIIGVVLSALLFCEWYSQAAKYYDSCYETYSAHQANHSCGKRYYSHEKCYECENIEAYPSKINFILNCLDFQDFVFCLIPVAFTALIGILVYFWLHSYEMVVTDKRIYGRVAWGKRVDLPLDFVSATATISLFKGISVSTSSGRIRFLIIKNAEEIYKIINNLLIERQSKKKAETIQETKPKTDNADELKKFKELLDSGVITQEEFEAKKKQLLGL